MKIKNQNKKTYSVSAVHKRGFTLTEMMVSIAVMVILLGMTAVIYKSANDAMHLNSAGVMITSDFEALTKQVDITMENVYTDGYLVIYGYDVGLDTSKDVVEKKPDGKVVFELLDENGNELPVRSDAICFFTTGNFKSLTKTNNEAVPADNKTISANSGWVYLGHAGSINPQKYGESPFDDEEQVAANRWVLSKYSILFAPGQPGTYDAPDSDFRNDTTLAYNMKSLAVSFYGQSASNIRDYFYDFWINDYDQATQYFGTPPAIHFGDEATDPYTFPYTLPNCGSFKVEFVMPATFLGTNNPLYPVSRNQLRLNSEPETYEADGSLVWRSAIDRNPVLGSESSGGLVATPAANTQQINADDLNERTNDAMVVFGPNDVWPLMIKFTIRKYDDDLTITSEEDFGADGVHTHGGRTLEYIYKLPVKQ